MKGFMRVLRRNRISSIVLVAFAALGAGVSASFDPPAYAVPLGTIDLDGGTETVTLDGAAFVGSGGAASALTGTIVNMATTAIHGVTISLEKEGPTGGTPSFGTAAVGSDVSVGPASTSTGTSATVTLSGSGLAGSGTSGFSCRAVSSSLCSEIKLSMTPFILVSIGDERSVRADLMESFAFRPAADRARHGIEDATHDCFAVEIRNTTKTAVIQRLVGEVVAPPDASVTIDHVALQDSTSGAAVSGAEISISGTKLTITGVSIDDEDEVRLVVAMRPAISNELIRLDLSAAFD